MTIDTSPATSGADRDRLAALHVPLVAHLVRQTLTRVPSSVDRSDLLAAGLLALLASARDEGPVSAASFAEWASDRVRGALVEELRSVDWAIRAACPRDPAAARARLDAVLAQLPEAARVAAALERTAGPIPTPRPTPSVRPADAVDPRLWAERVQCVALGLEELPQRLRHVARGYFLEQRTLADLAAEVGASEADAAGLLAEALVLLRGTLATAMPSEPTPQGRRLASTRAVAVQYAARRTMMTVSREQLETSA